MGCIFELLSFISLLHCLHPHINPCWHGTPLVQPKQLLKLISRKAIGRFKCFKFEMVQCNFVQLYVDSRYTTKACVTVVSSTFRRLLVFGICGPTREELISFHGSLHEKSVAGRKSVHDNIRELCNCWPTVLTERGGVPSRISVPNGLSG